MAGSCMSTHRRTSCCRSSAGTAAAARFGLGNGDIAAIVRVQGDRLDREICANAGVIDVADLLERALVDC